MRDSIFAPIPSFLLMLIIPRFTLFKSVFKQKKSFIFLCSRQRFLLASACWRGQSYRGDVFLVAIPKRAERFGKFPPIANTMCVCVCASSLLISFISSASQRWGSLNPLHLAGSMSKWDGSVMLLCMVIWGAYYLPHVILRHTFCFPLHTSEPTIQRSNRK